MENFFKRKIYLNRIGAGLLCLYAFFTYSHFTVLTDSFNTKTFTLYRDTELWGSKDYESFRIYTNETKAIFVINQTAINAAGKLRLDSLQTGDTVVIKYSSRAENILSAEAQIPIYYLKKGNQVYFNEDSYNKASNAGKLAAAYFFLVIGILLILQGFDIINWKVACIIGSISTIAIIALHSFNKL